MERQNEKNEKNITLNKGMDQSLDESINSIPIINDFDKITLEPNKIGYKRKRNYIQMINESKNIKLDSNSKEIIFNMTVKIKKEYKYLT